MTVKTISSAQSLGIALVRIVTGLILVMHGDQKLFVYGYAGTSGAFEQMGVPLPAISAAFSVGAEFLGGLALLLGIFTRIAGYPVALNMLGALLFVHAGQGFFLPAGYEFVLLLLAASISLILLGPGAFSLDQLLKREAGGPATADSTPAAKLTA